MEKSSSSASDDEAGLGTRKFTRAQRKRLRKKKLKEAALNRRKIIGPELPSSTLIGNGHHLHPEGGDIVAKHQSQDVRRIAAEGLESGIEQQLGDPSSCTSQNKQKQRRVSRKLAKGRLKPLTMEDCHQVPKLPDSNNEA